MCHGFIDTLSPGMLYLCRYGKIDDKQNGRDVDTVASAPQPQVRSVEQLLHILEVHPKLCNNFLHHSVIEPVTGIVLIQGWDYRGNKYLISR